MAVAILVGRLPQVMQEKIFAFAGGCLSRQHRGIPRVCKFWLFDDQQTLGLPVGGPICVLDNGGQKPPCLKTRMELLCSVRRAAVSGTNLIAWRLALWS